ncbi:MAG: hypothetical protein UR98_C0007G0012 [Parcubacteria group bacterium GW2011_GWA1_36_12]|nr:MAG: hypothetical protein UR98_C0007G0012 [Parcubacteria group bacterium GW2011_GWA1_36_12]
MQETTENRIFKNLMEYVKAMHRRYFHALSAFYVYEGLNEVIASNVIGQSLAEKNVKVISDFRNFFMPAKEALRVYFFLELAKMFDSSDQSLHINKILNITESNLKNLTVDAFKEYNENRVFTEELTAGYRGMDYGDVLLLKKMVDENKDILDKLNDYRDKWLAHDDIKKPEVPAITGEEVKKLFAVLEKILNSITGKLNSESWAYSMVEDESKYQTKLVIDHLRRFEPYRLKEIKEEIAEEMKKYKIDN